MTKKWRWSIVIGLAVIGIIFGSFFDLQISSGLCQTTAQTNRWFGIVMAAFGMTPVFICVSALGAGYILYAIKKDTKIWLKVILYIMAVVAFLASIYLQAHNVNSRNAFELAKNQYYIGLLVGLAVTGGGATLGYFMFRNVAGNSSLIAMIIMPAIVAIGMLCTDIVKDIMCRPRYRFLLLQDDLGMFKNWWESGKTLRENLLEAGTIPAKIIEEDFKSFPSGHATTAASLISFMVFLPRVDNKYKRYEPLLFYGALAWTILMAFSRIFIGAHFLSDVSFGILISSVIACAADLIFFKNKKETQDIINEKETIEA